MTGSLIGSDNFFALAAVLFATAAFAFWADKTKWGSRISGVVLAILLAMALSNAGIIPTKAPLYDAILSNVIPFAIPLLLFKANLRAIIKESGRTLIMFVIASAASVLGVFIGLLFLHFGADTPSLAGMFASTYIGGSLNFYSVEATRPLSDPSLMSAAVAADAFVGTFFIIAVVGAPSLPFMRKWIPSPIMDAAEKEGPTVRADAPKPEIDLVDMSGAMALSLAICAVGFGIANAIGAPAYGILIVTVLALVVANFFPKRMKALKGDMELGMIAIYLFLGVIGAASDLRLMVASALPLALFAFIVISVHLIVVFTVGGLLKFDLAEIVIASNAAGGGVATATPLAAGRGWRDLVTPAILCGTLGNATATFIGVALVKLYS